MRLGVAGIVLKESAPTSILDCIRRVAAGEQWMDPVVGRKILDNMLRRQAGSERAATLLTPKTSNKGAPGPARARRWRPT